jgi:hypothetical protein
MVKRRRVAPLFLAALMLALGAASAACAGIFGFEHLTEDGASETGTPAEGSIAETGGGTDAPSEAGPLCTDLGIPDRPIVDSGASDAPAQIHMAMSLIDFGIDSTQPAVGFNLDHTCSPTVATSSCKTKIDELTFDKYARDHDSKGLDNAGYGLLAYISYLGDAFAPKSINERLGAGQFGFVFRLANWNGMPEDDDVVVEVFPAISVVSENDAGAAQTTPNFDAADLWTRDRRFQSLNDFSVLKSVNGWVTGGRLVAAFSTLTMPMSVPDDPKPLDVMIREGYVSGMLVSDAAGWHLENAVLGGRWRTSDFLSQVRTIYIKSTGPLSNVVLCDQGLVPNIYGLVKTEVCNGRDIRGTSNEDSTQDSTKLPCDSISAGIKINTYGLAHPGPFGDLPPITPVRCQKDGSVPEGDDCAPAFP